MTNRNYSLVVTSQQNVTLGGAKAVKITTYGTGDFDSFN
jgi:hypothetical protein